MSKHFSTFCAVSDNQKGAIVEAIRDSIEAAGGKFYRRNAAGEYKALGTTDTKKRIAQALRDMKKQVKKKAAADEIRELKLKLTEATKPDSAKIKKKDKEILQLKTKLIKATTSESAMSEELGEYKASYSTLVHALVMQNDANEAKDMEIQELKEKFQITEKQLTTLESAKGKELKEYCEDAWTEFDAFLEESNNDCQPPDTKSS